MLFCYLLFKKKTPMPAQTSVGGCPGSFHSPPPFCRRARTPVFSAPCLSCCIFLFILGMQQVLSTYHSTSGHERCWENPSRRLQQRRFHHSTGEWLLLPGYRPGQALFCAARGDKGEPPVAEPQAYYFDIKFRVFYRFFLIFLLVIL